MAVALFVHTQMPPIENAGTFALTARGIGLMFHPSGRLNIMHPTEPSPEVQSPAQRAGIVAALACLGCLLCLFTLGKTAMERLELGWAAMLLLYALVPLVLTFTILSGSCIHREMGKVARALYLLGVSLLIFWGDCLLLAVIAFLTVAVMPLSRFHY